MKQYDCPHMMELLVDYLEDDLPTEKRAELDAHFAMCPPCVAFLESYKSTTHVCQSVLKIEMPDAMKSSLKGFLAKECGNEPTEES